LIGASAHSTKHAADFVVLDDVGLGQVPPQPDAPTAAHMLFNLIDDARLFLAAASPSAHRAPPRGRHTAAS
jgi:hypothetical protein